MKISRKDKTPEQIVVGSEIKAASGSVREKVKNKLNVIERKYEN